MLYNDNELINYALKAFVPIGAPFFANIALPDLRSPSTPNPLLTLRIRSSTP